MSKQPEAVSQAIGGTYKYLLSRVEAHELDSLSKGLGNGPLRSMS